MELSKNITAAILSFVLLAILSMGTGWSRAADGLGKCYKWSEAREIISKNKLKSGKEVLHSIKSEYAGKLVKVNYLELCTLNGRYIYRAIIIDSSNKAKYITVDAKSGGTLGFQASPIAPNSSIPFKSLLEKYKNGSTSKFMKKLFSK